MAFLALVMLATPGLALAQAPTAAPAVPVRNIDTTKPLQTYDTDLGGLSHVLGGMHYLRILCAGRGDQKWRSQMAQVMNLEGPPGTPRRVMMSQEFNAGYREQEERFTACTPDAQASEKTLMGQGARLSQALGARHRD
jgi:uncharacterized protein (TIGR02301 family)